MAYPLWLEVNMSRTNLHDSEDVRAFKYQLFVNKVQTKSDTTQDDVVCNAEMCGLLTLVCAIRLNFTLDDS